ncbi:glycosyltransferase [Sporosarcina sp. ACRSL]|uniref:glycosyltransferase n=1 Tax=Sporosarcina sp. ACRSL TaxID=2918215 RepID=UPI001EF4532F|nr:glycosyltransferase [Sporosarcina sp. ACRSL]MCG7343778.1 glycosyltransferase [Sporosarcina sp. ACRSL]
MKKKILFISDHGDPLAPLGGEQSGGQNNYVKQLALSLDRRGHSVDVVTHWANAKVPANEHFGSRCRVIRVAAGVKGYVPKSELYGMLFDFYDEMRSRIDLSSYDVMHTHYWLSGLLGARVAEDYGIPWIHTSHSLGVAKEQATGVREAKRMVAEQFILQSADTVIATTPSERKLINSFVDNPSPIKVIPIGVDESFQPFIRQKKQRPYFAFAGRLESTKGIYTLLNAFRLLIEKNELPPSAKLVIAGGEPNKIDVQKKMPSCPKLKKAISGIERHVEFIGARTQKQLAELFNEATAVIVPSTYESFGMVAAEAQACGSPVIASKVGGLQDVVRNQETGLHVEKENKEHLAFAMKLLAANREFARSLGRRAAAYARKEFNWTTVGQKMDALYEVVINGKQKVFAGD